VRLGSIQVVDSVHTEANANSEKDRTRQERGLTLADSDATVAKKGQRDVNEAGSDLVRKQIRCNGFKTHASMDTTTKLTASRCLSRWPRTRP
jgi:hypothetical protein